MTLQSNTRRLTIQSLKERILCLNVFDIVTVRRRGIKVKYCIHTCMPCMTSLLPVLRLTLYNSSLLDFDSFCQKWQNVSLVTAKEIMRNFFEVISLKHNIPLFLSFVFSNLSLSLSLLFLSLISVSLSQYSFSSLPHSNFCLNLPWQWVSVLVLKNQRLILKSSVPHWR